MLYAGQWKFGRASRLYITLVRWASRLEMLISTPGQLNNTVQRLVVMKVFRYFSVPVVGWMLYQTE